MSGSLKDALRKAGLAAPEKAKPKLEKKKWRTELPDDVPSPPPFEAPAPLKPTERSKKKSKS